MNFWYQLGVKVRMWLSKIVEGFMLGLGIYGFLIAGKWMGWF